jgi:erythromycin esterase
MKPRVFFFSIPSISVVIVGSMVMAQQLQPLDKDALALNKDAKSGSDNVRFGKILTSDLPTVHLTEAPGKIDSVKKWLIDNAIPLSTVEAGNGFIDMQPLRKLIGSARIVALGEATHGTREFFQFKHRMFEFLVNEMGFTVFGMEATMLEAFDVNEYVLTGKGDPEKALAGLYSWFWNTKEILEMIKWMRRYNADPLHTKKVKFYGFDNQNQDFQTSPRAVKVTLEYLRKVDPTQAATSEKALAVLSNPFTSLNFGHLPREKKEAAAESVSTILRLLDERKLDYVNGRSSTEWAIVKQHARILQQIIESGLVPEDSIYVYLAKRDSAMAENIRWILDHEETGAKMVLWAHNGHVAIDTSDGIKSMGYHLKRMYGNEMVVFGFAFNQGSFLALELPWPSEKGAHSFTAQPAPDSSLDATLAAAGLDMAVINFKRLPKDGPVTKWFSEGQLTRSLGLPYNEEYAAKYFYKQYVTQTYDAMFFVQKTTAAQLNEGGKRPGIQRLPIPSNLDFENSEPGKPPIDWMVPKQLPDFDYAVTTSENNPHTGNRCLMISRTPGSHYGEMYGSLNQRIDATKYRGKKIKLRGSVRANVYAGSQANLWLRIMWKGYGAYATAFYDNMADRPITTNEWCDYEIVGDVPLDAETIDYGFALTGEGEAWLDSVSIEVIE